MHLEPLPHEVTDLLSRLEATPRLVAHLTLVHDVACTLTMRLDAVWPSLAYDRSAVRMGAALHDIGKTIHREELTQPGHTHELTSEELLRAHGYPESLARFARTHGQHADDADAQPEDRLVAIADGWWRGKRNAQLESALCWWLAGETATPQWEVFAALDDIATEITADADVRLVWQQQFDS